MSKPFFAPLAQEGEGRFVLEATEQRCIVVPGRAFLMGGVAFAAMIEAMEQQAERPLQWATVQFIAPGVVGQIYDIALETVASGQSITQMQARLCHGDKVLMHTMAALGSRHGFEDLQFLQAPTVPGPMDCPAREMDDEAGVDDLRHGFEHRLVPVTEDGRSQMWMRCTRGEKMSAGLLAIIADFLATGHPSTHRAGSLDNTLRINQLEETEWVLCDMAVSALTGGVFHGRMNMYAESGTLLATAGQSGVVPRS